MAETCTNIQIVSRSTHNMLYPQNKNYALVCDMIVEREKLDAFAAFEGEDWLKLFSLARNQGVLSILYTKLGKYKTQIPEKMWRLLQTNYYFGVANATLLQRNIENVSQVFEEEEIDCIWLKGAAIATRYYPRPELRTMVDLDLLVHEKDVPRAIRALENLQFVQNEHEKITPGVSEITPYHIKMDGGKSNPIEIELHWRLISGEKDWRSPEIAWFWEKTKPWASGYTHVSVFDINATFLYQVAHMSLQHGGPTSRLIWYYDIYLLLQQAEPEIDWGVVFGQARQLEWEPLIHQVLEETHERFGIEIPAFEPIDTEGPLKSKAGDLSRLKANLPYSRGLRYFYFFKSLGWNDRARLTLGVLFPKKEFLFIKYPKAPHWTYPFLYVVKWAEMAGELFRAVRIFMIRVIFKK